MEYLEGQMRAHNAHWRGASQLGTDPHMAALEGLPHVAELDWWRAIDRATGGIYLLFGGPQAGKSTSLKLPAEMKKPLSAQEAEAMAKVRMPGNAVPEFATDLIFRRDYVGGQMARDMTLFVDDDGKAYHIYASEENSTLQISQLAPLLSAPVPGSAGTNYG